MSAEPSSPPGHVLFIDDDPDVLKAANLLLTRRGLRVSQARNPAEAWSVLAAEAVDVILLDLNFERGAVTGEEGFRCLAEITARRPDAAVVVVTGHSGVNIAVAAMRAGARDFVMKPWNNGRLIETVEAALAHRRSISHDPAAATEDHAEPLLGESPAIERIRALIQRAAPTDAAVLIRGAAGTGKSLIALALHQQSARASGPFISIDFAISPPDEAEAALFGAEAAAGALERARHGTLVLDEIAAMAPRLQGRLLEALQRHAVDARLIATTRRDSGALRGPGGLSDDLLYRLNTVEIVVPPLATRDGDALRLAQHFLRLYARRYGRPLKALSDDASETIAAHPWPGEIRGLRQAMERCVLFCEGETYQSADLFMGDLESAPAAPTAMNLATSEKELISRALKRNSFNVSHAAKALGLTRAALYRRMAKHGL